MQLFAILVMFIMEDREKKINSMLKTNNVVHHHCYIILPACGVLEHLTPAPSVTPQFPGLIWAHCLMSVSVPVHATSSNPGPTAGTAPNAELAVASPLLNPRILKYGIPGRYFAKLL